MGEFGVLPIARAMAIATFTAVTPGMFVIMLMAVKTGGAEFHSVKLASMTDVAADVGMGTGQFEFCVLVVIENDLLPFLFVMARPAFVAIAAIMHIVNAMACYAFPRQIFVTLVGMAAIAARFFMFAV